MKLTWKQIVIAFLLGGCVGFVVAKHCGPRMFHRHGDGTHFQQRLLDRFSSKLHLTQEQRSQVATILEAKRQKMDTLRAEIRPKFEELRTSTSADIRQLLTAEQQKKFDAMQAEWDAREKHFRDRWMGPGDTG